MSELTVLLTMMVEKGGSDLHLIPGSPPRLRVDGRLLPPEGLPLSQSDTQHLFEQVQMACRTHQTGASLENSTDFDCSFGLAGIGRFRCHVYRQAGETALAIRAIPLQVPSFENLGLPAVLGDLIKKPRGLFLVTGPSGSGKSTTLAALVDKVNEESRAHILTIEDPIEFLHTHKKGLVSQREIGADARTGPSLLKSILREDPDVVFFDEMGDRDTVEIGLTLAETGHLTLATLHTHSCVQTLHHMIGVFPPHQQAQIRTQLALVLGGIVSQALVPKLEGPGRVLALEILIPTPAVRNLIRDDKIHQVYSVMQTGQARYGMQTMNQALLDLSRKRLISVSAAMEFSSLPDELQGMVHRTDSRVRSTISRSFS